MNPYVYGCFAICGGLLLVTALVAIFLKGATAKDGWKYHQDGQK